MAEITYNELCRKVFDTLTTQTVYGSDKVKKEAVRNYISWSRRLKEGINDDGKEQKNVDCGIYHDKIHTNRKYWSDERYMGIYYNDVLFSRVFYNNYQRVMIPTFTGIEKYGNLPASEAVKLVREDMGKPDKPIWDYTYGELCKELDEMMADVLFPDNTRNENRCRIKIDAFDREPTYSVNMFQDCILSTFEQRVSWEKFPNLYVVGVPGVCGEQDRDKVDGSLAVAKIFFSFENEKYFDSDDKIKFTELTTIYEKDGKLSSNFEERDWLQDRSVLEAFTILHNQKINAEIQNLKTEQQSVWNTYDSKIMEKEKLLREFPQEADKNRETEELDR